VPVSSDETPPGVPGESAAPAGATLGLGHRRLSILDLSPAGHQPMRDAAGECWLTYNGEIYNYAALRSELALLGHAFHTGTDTEVILAAWREWGERCLAASTACSPSRSSTGAPAGSSPRATASG